MATSPSTIQYICDQAGFGPRLAFRKMFGEYALYLDGKVVALVCDDQLFLKPCPEGQRHLGRVELAPPYPGAKDHFLLVAELDDPERLHAAMDITARTLPDPAPRVKRRGKAKSTSKAKPKANADRR